MQPSAYDAPSQRLGQRGVLAKPAQVQLYVWTTLTQAWVFPAQMRVPPRTSKSPKNVRQSTSKFQNDFAGEGRVTWTPH